MHAPWPRSKCPSADIDTPERVNDAIVIGSVDLASPVLLKEEMAWLLTPALRCDRLGSTLNAGRGLEPVHPRAKI